MKWSTTWVAAGLLLLFAACTEQESADRPGDVEPADGTPAEEQVTDAALHSAENVDALFAQCMALHDSTAYCGCTIAIVVAMASPDHIYESDGRLVIIDEPPAEVRAAIDDGFAACKAEYLSDAGADTMGN